MQRRTLSAIVLGAAVCLFALPAAAKLDRKLLLGTWEGRMVVKTDKEIAMGVQMVYQEDGIVLITSLDEKEKKASRVPYVIEGDVIVYMKEGTREPEVRLTKIKLTKDKLEGMLVPAREGQGAIRLELEKKK